MSERLRAVITGASSGIGRATAIRFAADGYDVCLNARRESRLRQLLSELPPGDHLVCPGDYQEPKTADTMRTLLTERWGRVDALVNCAGIFRAGDAIEEPIDSWRLPFDAMVNGGVQMTRVVVPLMLTGGRI